MKKQKKRQKRQLVQTVSGVRGVIGNGHDPVLVATYGAAFGTYLKEGWLQLRKSNMEPIFRLIIETSDRRLAADLHRKTIRFFN